MNRLIVSVVLMTIAVCVYAQSNLSRSGAIHLRAAEALIATATSTDDKLQVAEEYEKVIETDPYFAKAYLEAARIYSALTPELGESVYEKARRHFNCYSDLIPSESDKVESELIVLDAMMRKYNNGPTKVIGIWRRWVPYNQTYHDYLEVRTSGTGYDLKLINPDGLFVSSGGRLKDVDITVNGNFCTIVVQVFHDFRSELRKKGWRKYVDDCDGDADPGFPRYGEYYYNESLTTWYYNVNLSQTPLVMECEKIHTDYYLDGVNTYSDTDRDNMSLFRQSLSKK